MRTLFIATFSTLIAMVSTYSLTTFLVTGDLAAYDWMSGKASVLFDSVQLSRHTPDPPFPDDLSESPPIRPDDFAPAGGQTAVHAVVLKSWGGCSAQNTIWDDLNQHWSEHGKIPINIDYAHTGLCDGPITYQKLVDSAADVLILSNPAGGGRQFSSTEIEAIQQYLLEGHHLLGTYAVFQFGHVDNRSLAPLFGIAYTPFKSVSLPQAPAYLFTLPDHSLMVDITNPFSSQGYPSVQVPNTGTWNELHLTNAVYVAITADQQGAITIFEEGDYNAIYISNMPEYGGEMVDKQLLYNALTFSRKNEFRTPLVFIPGLMGSRLFNNPEGIGQDELWADLPKLTSLFSFPHPLMPLELTQDGETPASDDPAYTSIHTLPGSAGVITRLSGTTWGYTVDEDFYDSLVDHFLDNGYLEEVDFWVFPYDWRKDLNLSADQLDDFIQEILVFTASTQVDILAHSLGGLLTRTYIFDPDRAENVRRSVILGTPFTGTPKAFHALNDGECLYKLPIIGYCLPKKHIIEALIPNYSSLYQLMPSQDYYLLKGGGFYGMGRTIDVAGICSDCLAFHETYSTTIAPQLNPFLFGQAVEFHYRINDFTDWNDVEVTIVAGQNQQTLVGTRQYPRWSWGQFQIGTVREPVFQPSGDGTVTLMSASLANSETGINLLDNAELQVFDARHQDLVSRADILDFIHSVFNQTAEQIPEQTPVERYSAATGVQIMAFGAASIQANDTQGNYTGLLEDNQIVQASIPGSHYAADDKWITIALTTGQEYTITVRLSGRQPVDLKLVRTHSSNTQSITLYLGISATEDTLLKLVGDPFEVDTWSLTSADGQNLLQTISPTRIIHDHHEMDEIPPPVTIHVEADSGPEGWYQQPVLVTLQASDDPGGSSVSRIEYATREDQQVRVYTGPFLVDPQQTSILYAVAVDHSGNMSVEAAQVRIGPERLYIPVVER